MDDDLGFLGRDIGNDGVFQEDAEDDMFLTPPTMRPSLPRAPPPPPRTIPAPAPPPMVGPPSWSGALYVTVCADGCWMVPKHNEELQCPLSLGTRLLVLGPCTKVGDHEFMETVVAHPVTGEPLFCLVLVRANGRPLVNQFSVTEVYSGWVESCFGMDKQKTTPRSAPCDSQPNSQPAATHHNKRRRRKR